MSASPAIGGALGVGAGVEHHAARGDVRRVPDDDAAGTVEPAGAPHEADARVEEPVDGRRVVPVVGGLLPHPPGDLGPVGLDLRGAGEVGDPVHARDGVRGGDHHLRRHAAVVGALAADQAVLDRDHVEAGPPQLDGGVLPSGAEPDHDDIDVLGDSMTQRSHAGPRCAAPWGHDDLTTRACSAVGWPGVRCCWSRLHRRGHPVGRPGSAATTTSTAGATPTGSPSADLVVPDFDPEDWDSVRAQFPLDPSVAQFAAFVLSPHTAQVDAAIDHHRRRLAFDTEAALLAGIEQEAAVIDAAAAYTGGTPAQFALTDSTTMGIATMYGGLTLQPGDEVLSTTHDFYSTEDSLRLLEQRTGAQGPPGDAVRRPGDGHRRRRWRAAGRGRSPPRTRVVAITWVHSSTGVRLPIAEIGAAVADAQPRPVSARTRSCSASTACTASRPSTSTCPTWAATSWRPAPTSGCSGRAAPASCLGARLGPADRDDPDFSGPDGPGPAHPRRLPRLRAPVGARRRLRVPRPDRPGPGRGADRRAGDAAQGGHRRDRRAPAGDAQDPEVSAGIVCVDVPAMLPADAVARLRERGVVASATPYATSYLRLGPSIVTTPEQVDAAVRGGVVPGLISDARCSARAKQNSP